MRQGLAVLLGLLLGCAEEEGRQGEGSRSSGRRGDGGALVSATPDSPSPEANLPVSGQPASRQSASRQQLQRLLHQVGEPAAEFRHESTRVVGERVELLGLVGADLASRWTALTGPDGVGAAPEVLLSGAGSGTEGHSEGTDARSSSGVRWGPGALAAATSLRSGQFYELVLRVRALDGAGRIGGEFTALAQPLNAEVELGAWFAKKSLRDLGRIHGTRTRVRPAAQYDPGRVSDEEGQELRLRLCAPYDAKSVLITLLVSAECAGSFEVRSLSFAQIPLREGLGLDSVAEAEVASMPPGAGGLLAELPPLPPSVARQVEVLHELRDALLLPPPSARSFLVLLPAEKVVLEFGRALLDEVRKGWHSRPIELEVNLVDEAGEPHAVYREVLGAEDAASWVDRQVDLSEWSDQLVRLEFRSRAEAVSDVLVVGAPCLRVIQPTDRRPNVVVVSLDTLRADRLHCQGYPRETSPFLDRLARESQWFRNVSSTSAYTLPSHSSALTGQLPRLHGVRRIGVGITRLSTRRSEPLAVRLAEEGYATAAFTGGGYMGHEFGFALGFDRFNWLDVMLTEEDGRWELHPRRKDPAFNLTHRRQHGIEQVLNWTGQHRDGPFFLLLHTYLVHNYRPSPAYREMFYSDGGSELGASLAWPRRRVKAGEVISAVDCQHYADLYDATVREADDLMRRLVLGLQEQGLWENTVFLILGDHGEEFAERGEMGHGHSLYEELLRVPMIWHVPGEPEAREIEAPVSLVDVQPTVLDLLGLRQRMPVQGQSLRPLFGDGSALEDEVRGERPLFADLARAGTSPRLSVRRGRWKLIATFDDDSVEAQPRSVQLFDLSLDPLEKHDRAAQMPERCAELQALIRDQRADLQQQFEILGGGGAAEKMSDETRRQLQRLGYLPEDPDTGAGSGAGQGSEEGAAEKGD